MRRFALSAALVLSATTSFADPKEDATFIVQQTLTENMFAAAIFAQKDLIASALLNDLGAQGITLSDPDRFVEILVEEFLAEFTETMQAGTVDVYLNRFTPQQLSELAAFYRSDTGQALLAATPELMQTGATMGSEAGRRAGLNAGPRVAERLKNENVVLTADPTLMQRLIDALR